MSKLPVREAKKAEILSPWVQAGLALLQGVLPAMTAIIGGLYVLRTHVEDQARAERALAEQQKQATTARYFEARKPFYDKQLGLYFEAARVGGLLATLDPASPEWTTNKARFYALYWSELSMVEDRSVEASMVNVERTLRMFAASTVDHQAVRRQAYCLAHSLKNSISTTWKVDFNPANLPEVPAEAPLRDGCNETVSLRLGNQ